MARAQVVADRSGRVVHQIAGDYRLSREAGTSHAGNDHNETGGESSEESIGIGWKQGSSLPIGRDALISGIACVQLLVSRQRAPADLKNSWITAKAQPNVSQVNARQA